MERMLLNSDDSELLIAFEMGKTVEKTAQIIGKDPSGVSRQLTRVSKLCAAVEKRDGKWALTETGRELAAATKEFIRTQNQLSQQKSVLKIGTNREFGSRMFANHYQKLQKLFPRTHFSISTYESGTEEALLFGKIDIGIDCEKPINPTIGFRYFATDPVIAVCTPEFSKKHKAEIKKNDLSTLPHLLCDRLFPHLFSGELIEVDVHASFNDIATTRSMCLAGHGWALLPRYAVREELNMKSLVQMSKKSWSDVQYGVWWSRDRNIDKNIVKQIIQWAHSIKI
ncbi:MAG: substrate-binding domain-containing protein [Pseudomonadota bacterium]